MKVRFLPLQPHAFAFGGFEIQMLAAFNAIKQFGIKVEKQDIWDRNSDFDILHCWGLGFSNYENFVWAKKAGKKLVATVLLHHYESLSKKARFYLSSYLHSQKFFVQMMGYVDSVVVVNEKQAEVCNELYKVPEFKISVIPNIVSSNYFNANVIADNSACKPYILTVGNICFRKNQVNLAKACIKEGIDLVIVGDTLPGEELYASKLSELIKDQPQIRLIQGLKENSLELVKEFYHCSGFALPSYTEQQPISLLEAAVLRKPILTANSIYAKQKYYSKACLVNPASISSIQSGISKLMECPNKYIPDYADLLECTEKNVAAAYAHVYSHLKNG